MSSLGTALISLNVFVNSYKTVMLEVIVNMELYLGVMMSFLVIYILFYDAVYTAGVSTYCGEFSDSV
jgi:hypothetical protein